MNIFKVNDQVNGKYCDVPFTGKIVESRPNFADFRSMIYKVDLHTPIEVYCQKRESILIHSNSSNNEMKKS